jgi:hypothetical protein
MWMNLFPKIINYSSPGGSSEEELSQRNSFASGHKVSLGLATNPLTSPNDSDSDSEGTSKTAKVETQSVRLSKIPTRRNYDSDTDDSSVGSSDASSGHATKDQIRHSSSLIPLAMQSPGIKTDDSNDSDHSSSVESKQFPVKQAANNRSQKNSKYTDDSDDASSAEANKNRNEMRNIVATNHSDAELDDSSDDASRPTGMQQLVEKKLASRSHNSQASISDKSGTVAATLTLGKNCGSSQSIRSIDVISNTLEGSSSPRNWW